MLKSWVVKVLSKVLASWFVFVVITIDSLGNKTYNIILIVWTTLAIISFYLLKKYSTFFEEID